MIYNLLAIFLPIFGADNSSADKFLSQRLVVDHPVYIRKMETRTFVSGEACEIEIKNGGKIELNKEGYYQLFLSNSDGAAVRCPKKARVYISLKGEKFKVTGGEVFFSDNIFQTRSGKMEYDNKQLMVGELYAVGASQVIPLSKNFDLKFLDEVEPPTAQQKFAEIKKTKDSLKNKMTKEKADAILEKVGLQNSKSEKSAGGRAPASLAVESPEAQVIEKEIMQESPVQKLERRMKHKIKILELKLQLLEEQIKAHH